MSTIWLFTVAKAVLCACTKLCASSWQATRYQYCARRCGPPGSTASYAALYQISPAQWKAMTVSAAMQSPQHKVCGSK